MTTTIPEKLPEQKLLARGLGRRKEAVAQVQLMRGSGEIIINGRPALEYLHNNSCSILAIKSPFEILHKLENALIKVEGGGLIGQAEAIKLGIARAISQFIVPENEAIEIRKSLKNKGYLTVDSRIKERRKYGLKKARKASQYHKR